MSYAVEMNMIIKTLVSQETSENFSRHYISREKLFRGRIFKVYQLTSGVQFNQWKVLLVTQGSMNHSLTIAVVYEIIILILLAYI